MSKVFYFRRFIIRQDQSAMKVGTDSMLLGAYAPVNDADSILDIGTGTGVLAMMLAQRTSAHIDAIEPEESAYRQACNNVSQSSWHHRIMLYNTSLQEFNPGEGVKYDLIISNPPYFKPYGRKHELRNERGREKARSNESLSMHDLTEHAASLLSKTGNLYVILPFHVEDDFLKTALDYGLNLIDHLNISSFQNSPAIRVILGLSKKNKAAHESSLYIYNSDRTYSLAYKKLTEPYHARNLK